MTNRQRHDVTEALDALVEAVERNEADGRQLVARLSGLRDALARGIPMSEALAGEEPPGTMQLLGIVLIRLMDTSGAARRALARTLREEGESIPSIARNFGVTHQRISSILNRAAGGEAR